jgi:hypothetical protein
MMVFGVMPKIVEKNKFIFKELRMSKIEAILGVYGSNLRKSIKVGDEEITGWYIDGISENQLQEKFTKEEIEYIYYNIF